MKEPIQMQQVSTFRLKLFIGLKKKEREPNMTQTVSINILHSVNNKAKPFKNWIPDVILHSSAAACTQTPPQSPSLCNLLCFASHSQSGRKTFSKLRNWCWLVGLMMEWSLPGSQGEFTLLTHRISPHNSSIVNMTPQFSSKLHYSWESEHRPLFVLVCMFVLCWEYPRKWNRAENNNFPVGMIKP